MAAADLIEPTPKFEGESRVKPPLRVVRVENSPCPWAGKSPPPVVAASVAIIRSAKKREIKKRKGGRERERERDSENREKRQGPRVRII